MPKIDSYEQEIIAAFDKGSLKSVATKAELAKFKLAARATAIKDKRVNIRLSSGDLHDIQAKALQNNFRVDDEAAGAKLWARIMHLFQNQDSGGKMRSDLCQMQGCGESAWSTAKNKNLDVHTPILP